ncbi:MAG: glycine hydroxymethyltransferase [Verrucomicrobia bacterium]|nr:glycine hydroxymethyltransferase [Verrucomicrobiota bacterium]MBS0636029.1 glycine hydroxymethyltransferase [Verrucomicrobiota bacterium]
MQTNFLEHYLTKNPEARSKAAIAYLASLDYLSSTHPHVAEKIVQELKDQRSYLKMIASENYSSLSTQLAMGNLLTDKYAEGYPFHRFYAGCDNVDAVEHQAEESLKALFGSQAAYVQPHSGADANLVAFWAILIKNVQSKELEKLAKKSIEELTAAEYETIRQQLVNQKVLGMSLNSGGHLTHGYRHNISSKIMKAAFYDVDPKTERIDYAALMQKAKEEKPLILLAGYSAHPRKINFAKMKEIAAAVGATLMVDMAHFAGLVAGKAFTGEYDPIPFADIVTTTTHKTLRGPRGGAILCTEEYKEFVNKGCPLVLGGPLPHVLAAKACAFEEARQESFVHYAHKVIENAQTLAEGLIEEGFRLVTGGTENHMVIVDISSLNITGRQAETALRQAHITCNRNAIPFDPNGAWYTSGIRLGTPALTTLGMGKTEMKKIAKIIGTALKNTKAATAVNGQQSKSQILTDALLFEKLKGEVSELLHAHPLYPEIDLSEQNACVSCR